MVRLLVAAAGGVVTDDAIPGGGQVPGMPEALCHACGLGQRCGNPACPNVDPDPPPVAGKVVSLAERRAALVCDAVPAEPPSLEGEAGCMVCRKRWQAVAPIGVLRLECPFCGLMQGAWVHSVSPRDPVIWHCGCGNDLFVLPPNGPPMCAACGVRATGWVEA